MNSPRTRRRSSGERRQEIAEATLRLIGERGLASLTTAAIAGEIGVTSGALFRHFSSRDEILTEAVLHAVDRIEATFPDPSLPADERLRRLVESRVALLASEPGVAWLVRSNQVYVSLPEGAVTALRDLVRRSRRYLVESIREGASQGVIRDDIEPDVLVVAVIGTIHAIIQPPGAHLLEDGDPTPAPDRVLAGLMRLLAPAPTRQEPVEP